MEKSSFRWPGAGSLPRIGIIVVLITAFLLIWFLVRVGEDLVNNVPRSKIYDTQKGAQKMLESKR